MKLKSDKQYTEQTERQSYPHKILSGMHDLDEDQRGIYVDEAVQEEKHAGYQVLLVSHEFHQVSVGDQVTDNHCETQDENEHIEHLELFEGDEAHEDEGLQTHAQEGESASSEEVRERRENYAGNKLPEELIGTKERDNECIS